jgi:hypothetical protein
MWWPITVIRDTVQFLDREFARDLLSYRDMFAAVDTTDPASLQQWFRDHPYLSTNNQALIAQVSLKTVQRWKNGMGQPRARLSRPVLGWRRPRRVLAVPADWMNGTRLQEIYSARYSIRDIAWAIGRSYTATRRQLQRQGVVLRPASRATRSMHYCCTRRWLREHYVAARLSLTRCARLARVSSYTMTTWLLHYEIRIRSNGEQQVLNRSGRLRCQASQI